MQEIYNQLAAVVKAQLLEEFGIENPQIVFQETRKEFRGDITLTVFPFTKAAKLSPPQLAQKIGDYLLQNSTIVAHIEVVQGFLNIGLKDEILAKHLLAPAAHRFDAPKRVVVEYASPNTNKPLHLGHVRNFLLGYAVANLQKAVGNTVFKVQIINDRGIHICKSMLAWQLYGNGETPQTAMLKGDHLVGKYYVAFNTEYKKQVAALVQQGKTEAEAEKQAPILLQAQEMLRLWETNDADTLALWNTMNGWVYEGFEETYRAFGVDFDKLYYESDTYLLGKAIVAEGLEKQAFYQKTDGSVWVDLTEQGLDHKLLLRSDGTSVYITQDIGLGMQRDADFAMDKSIYTVGNEQDYHFKVLFLIFKKLGYAWAANCFHLSYGMVELPSGKMKSREGTVVDADDLMAEMVETAKIRSQELGKISELSADEQEKLSKMLGLGALKYFILRIDPKKSMVFNPEESISLQGNTATFIQYAYTRLKSLLRRADLEKMDYANTAYNSDLLEVERSLCLQILQYNSLLQVAADSLSPALLANYCYETAQKFNKFYQECSIFNETDEDKKHFRLALCNRIAQTFLHATQILGIEMPEKM